MDFTKSKDLFARIKDLSVNPTMELYDEASKHGMTMTNYLEYLDPSRPDDELDAFERQLYLANMKVNSDTQAPKLAELIASSVGILTAEFFRREVMRGMQMYFQTPGGKPGEGLLAARVPVNGNNANPLYISAPDTKGGSLKARTSGSQMSTLDILYREKTINVQDYGKVLNIDDKVLKYKNTVEFKSVLHQIGMNIAVDKVIAVESTIRAGDGTVGAPASAQTVTSGAAGQANMVYSDFVSFVYAIASPYTLNAAIMTTNQLITFLNLSEIKDPDAFMQNFTNKGKVVTPFGFTIFRNTGGNDRYVSGIDHRFAITEGVEQELMIDTDKIISRSMKEVAIKESVCYWVNAELARAMIDFQQ